MLLGFLWRIGFFFIIVYNLYGDNMDKGKFI